MKARRVKHLDPEAPLADAAERIVRIRLEELHSFVPRALDPAEVEALHDLRIAAKRLRYVLEVTAPCFGDYARAATKRARDLQDVIGEVHDCDVMLPRVESELAALRATDVAALRDLAGDSDIEARLAGRAPGRSAYRGLELLAVRLAAQREVRFERFLATWEKLGRDRFRRRLEDALVERPAEVANRELPIPRLIQMFSGRSA